MAEFFQTEDSLIVYKFVVVFALSKRPHFHSAYLVTVCKQKLVAVGIEKDIIESF